MIEQKLIILECDNALVKAFTTEPLPGIKGTLDKLKQAGKFLAVASKQAGPIWRRGTGNIKFPTASKLIDNLNTIAQSLELADTCPWFISLGDSRAEALYVEMQEPLSYMGDLYEIEAILKAESKIKLHTYTTDDMRMPNPGMLVEACRFYKIETNEALFVGNMESDITAAYAAGMQFMRTKKLIETISSAGQAEG